MGGRQGSNVIFFSSNLQRSPYRKKRGGPVAPPTVGGATGSLPLCFKPWPTKPIEFHKIPPASEDLL